MVVMVMDGDDVATMEEDKASGMRRRLWRRIRRR